MQLLRDDDEGYERWLDQNPDGLLVNTKRQPSATYLMLHRATCGHISSHRPNVDWHWTRDYVKVCATGRQELEEWARRDLGGTLVDCRSCLPMES